jgi:hypothetical protein
MAHVTFYIPVIFPELQIAQFFRLVNYGIQFMQIPVIKHANGRLFFQLLNFHLFGFFPAMIIEG